MYEGLYVRISENNRKSKGEQSFLFIRSLAIFDPMPPFYVWMVTAVGLFGTSAAFFSFTGNRDAFHIHSTPQMCTASELFCQLWKNSRFGAVSTNGSKSDLGYALAMFAGSITKAVNWKLVKLQIEVNRVFLISFRPGLDAVLHMSRVGRVVP